MKTIKGKLLAVFVALALASAGSAAAQPAGVDPGGQPPAVDQQTAPAQNGAANGNGADPGSQGEIAFNAQGNVSAQAEPDAGSQAGPQDNPQAGPQDNPENGNGTPAEQANSQAEQGNGNGNGNGPSEDPGNASPTEGAPATTLEAETVVAAEASDNPGNGNGNGNGQANGPGQGNGPADEASANAQAEQAITAESDAGPPSGGEPGQGQPVEPGNSDNAPEDPADASNTPAADSSEGGDDVTETETAPPDPLTDSYQDTNVVQDAGASADATLEGSNENGTFLIKKGKKDLGKVKQENKANANAAAHNGNNANQSATQDPGEGPVQPESAAQDIGGGPGETEPPAVGLADDPVDDGSGQLEPAATQDLAESTETSDAPDAQAPDTSSADTDAPTQDQGDQAALPEAGIAEEGTPQLEADATQETPPQPDTAAGQWNGNTQSANASASAKAKGKNDNVIVRWETDGVNGGADQSTTAGATADAGNDNSTSQTVELEGSDESGTSESPPGDGAIFQGGENVQTAQADADATVEDSENLNVEVWVLSDGTGRDVNQNIAAEANAGAGNNNSWTSQGPTGESGGDEAAPAPEGDYSDVSSAGANASAAVTDSANLNLVISVNSDVDKGSVNQNISSTETENGSTTTTKNGPALSQSLTAEEDGTSVDLTITTDGQNTDLTLVVQSDSLAAPDLTSDDGGTFFWTVDLTLTVAPESISDINALPSSIKNGSSNDWNWTNGSTQTAVPAGIAPGTWILHVTIVANGKEKEIIRTWVLPCNCVWIWSIFVTAEYGFAPVLSDTPIDTQTSSAPTWVSQTNLASATAEATNSNNSNQTVSQVRDGGGSGLSQIAEEWLAAIQDASAAAGANTSGANSSTSYGEDDGATQINSNSVVATASNENIVDQTISQEQTAGDDTYELTQTAVLIVDVLQTADASGQGNQTDASNNYVASGQNGSANQSNIVSATGAASNESVVDQTTSQEQTAGDGTYNLTQTAVLIVDVVQTADASGQGNQTDASNDYSGQNGSSNQSNIVSATGTSSNASVVEQDVTQIQEYDEGSDGNAHQEATFVTIVIQSADSTAGAQGSELTNDGGSSTNSAQAESSVTNTSTVHQTGYQYQGAIEGTDGGEQQVAEQSAIVILDGSATSTASNDSGHNGSSSSSSATVENSSEIEQSVEQLQGVGVEPKPAPTPAPTPTPAPGSGGGDTGSGKPGAGQDGATGGSGSGPGSGTTDGSAGDGATGGGERETPGVSTPGQFGSGELTPPLILIGEPGMMPGAAGQAQQDEAKAPPSLFGTPSAGAVMELTALAFGVILLAGAHAAATGSASSSSGGRRVAEKPGDPRDFLSAPISGALSSGASASSAGGASTGFMTIIAFPDLEAPGLGRPADVSLAPPHASDFVAPLPRPG